MTASGSLSEPQFRYDRNIVGRVTAHLPEGGSETFYTAGTGLRPASVRHPRDVPVPLYHGAREDLSGKQVEPGHPGNFTSRMTHVYATEQAEPSEDYKGARGYGKHVYEVAPTGWYGHRRDARGVEWASSHPFDIKREVK